MDNHKEHKVPEGTKLTAVTIGHGSGRVQFFAHLPHIDGKAKLSRVTLDQAVKARCETKSNK